mmetsp:Transcript_7507/g.14855  ORF Transcript_7507/g.14855 Transcript_7507/m.14855 type:complete len:413 (+) Transcript_7507:204-1442(+)
MPAIVMSAAAKAFNSRSSPAAPPTAPLGSRPSSDLPSDPAPSLHDRKTAGGVPEGKQRRVEKKNLRGTQGGAHKESAYLASIHASKHGTGKRDKDSGRPHEEQKHETASESVSRQQTRLDISTGSSASSNLNRAKLDSNANASLTSKQTAKDLEMAKKGGKGGDADEPRGPGAKAKAQKLAAQKAKEGEAAAKKEARVAANWEDGANAKADARRKAAEEKERAKLAAAQAKKEAEANDNVELSKMRAPVGKARKAAKAKKSKNDLSLLDAFLDGEKKDAKAKAAKKAAQAGEKPLPANVEPQMELRPNLNRVRAEEAAQGHIEASGLDAALAAFEASSLQDSSSGVGSAAAAVSHKGPNRKMLFSAFEEREIARLRAENPGLKRSQLKDHAWKLWQKSPENPANQVNDEETA